MTCIVSIAKAWTSICAYEYLTTVSCELIEELVKSISIAQSNCHPKLKLSPHGLTTNDDAPGIDDVGRSGLHLVLRPQSQSASRLPFLVLCILYHYLILSNTTLANMSGLEKALFNLKVSHTQLPRVVNSTKLTNTPFLQPVHSKATQPTSSKSRQRRADRARETEEGAVLVANHSPP